ncbi:hypothetical protein F3Y22_tig00116980pilonHSYRG00029 [Hibiscus syriacus]|uniref:Uncharacterized protein n=1 Tax=Hibiscus syriacus TaxID=106335 RepID=A0A6A2XN33_HIBSY|nr:hypothetical protein F3Y22_tig00116980pilonHSYRG00029 [Hibiscus syriacus]
MSSPRTTSGLRSRKRCPVNEGGRGRRGSQPGKLDDSGRENAVMLTITKDVEVGAWAVRDSPGDKVGFKATQKTREKWVVKSWVGRGKPGQDLHFPTGSTVSITSGSLDTLRAKGERAVGSDDVWCTRKTRPVAPSPRILMALRFSKSKSGEEEGLLLSITISEEENSVDGFGWVLGIYTYRDVVCFWLVWSTSICFW